MENRPTMTKKRTTAPLASNDEISLLYHILARANELASNTELDDLLDQMLDLIIEVCGGDAGTLYLLDSERNELEIKVVKGPGSDQSLIGRRIKTDLGIAGATMQTAQPVIIEDLANDPRWQRLSSNVHELRNVISLPLLLRSQPIGVVQVFNYSKSPLPIMQLLCTRMASEIEKTVLLKASEKRTVRLEALVDIIGVIGSTLDKDEVLRMIVGYVKELLQAEHASLFLIDDAANDIVLHISTNANSDNSLRVPRGKGIIGYVVDSGETVLVSDVTKDDRHYHAADNATGITTASLIAVPLVTRTVQLGAELGVAHTRIIGGLEAINKIGGSFKEEDANLLRTLARQAATVLQIAKLYSDANELFLDTIQAMVASIDAKDPYTNGHSQRVSDFSTAIGRHMNLPAEQLHHLRIGALLHDIGKIGVPDMILTKPGRLTDDEKHKMNEHPAIGAHIMQNVRMLTSELPALAEHHEHLDGTGYPNGLAGDNISLFGRIVAVADVFDALTSERPYRSAMNVEEVFGILQRDAGTHFDGQCVDAFIRAYMAGEVKTQKQREIEQGDAK
jgi:HD-GYP domain-containing protein (c-di-GMP phosphodiesterase class II)